MFFLTFDDWGTDQSINKLLYVLKKHRVKATFFVLTQNVQNNPNLLRIIAEDGHEVASHSDSHTPLTPSQIQKKGSRDAKSGVLHYQKGDKTVWYADSQTLKLWADRLQKNSNYFIKVSLWRLE